MVSPKQQAIDTVWSKYRVALQRLDKALDKLGSLPKQPTQAVLRPLNQPKVEIPGLDDEPRFQTTFMVDGVATDIRDLKPEMVHNLFTDGKLPTEYNDLITLEKREDYIQSKAVTSRGESRPKLHQSEALRGIYPDWNTRIGLKSDNTEPVEGEIGFGTQFPKQPNKGDTYLRVDQLPTKLFKFNGQKWIELDKEISSSYSYNDEYIKYLINMINTGQYDTELLTEAEKAQVEELIKSGRLNGKE